MPHSHRGADLSKHLSPTAIKNDTKFINLKFLKKKKIKETRENDKT